MAAYCLGLAEEILVFPGAILELRASQTDFLRILTISFHTIYNTAAAVSGISLGLGFAGTIGTPLTAYKLYPEDPFPTSGAAEPGAYVSTAWTTPPTIPTSFYRRLTAGSQITGSNVNSPAPIEFGFPKGLVVPFGESAVVWVIAVTGQQSVALNTTIVVDA